jgi:hypothetical protein
MRNALLILRKDARHLWPRTLVFVALAAVNAGLDIAMPRNPMEAGAEMFCGALVWLAAAFVVVSVVHQDSLTGDRQFWVTRPYSWRSLLLAKFLFVLLFLNLPMLLAQSAALAANGLSPLRYAPQLLLRQLGFVVSVAVPCAALAAVTADMVQVVLAALAGFAALYAALLELSRLLPFSNDVFAWGCAQPFSDTCQALLMLLFAGIGMGLQYSRRATWPARCLVACGLLVPWLFPFVAPWGAAFALLARSSPAVDPAVVRLSPGPTRISNNYGYWGVGGAIPVLFPIQVTGIPAGMAVISERIQVTAEAPGGERWNSDWSSANQIPRDAPAWSPDHLISSDGPYWIEVHIAKSFADRFLEVPVHLRATVAFTLLGRATTTVMPVGRLTSVADGGFCHPTKRNGLFSVFCATPLQRPAMTRVRLLPESQYPEYQSLGGVQSFPSSRFSIWEMLSGGAQYRLPATPSAVSFESRPGVTHFERVLDLPGVRLGEGIPQ